jgi:hypothetical protein
MSNIVITSIATTPELLYQDWYESCGRTAKMLFNDHERFGLQAYGICLTEAGLRVLHARDPTRVKATIRTPTITVEARNELAATENEYNQLQQAWILQAQPGLYPPNYVPDPEIEIRFQELVARRYQLLERKIGSFRATPHPYPEAPPLPAINANKVVWKEYELLCAYASDFWKAHSTLKTAMLASLGPIQLRQLNHPHSDTSTLSAQDIFIWVTQRYGHLKLPDIIKVQELMKKKFSTLEEFHNDISEFRHCRNALIRCDSAISNVNLKIILIEKTA